MDELVNMLTTRRADIVEILKKNYSYSHLIEVFTSIEEDISNYELEEKNVYRYLSGTYPGSIYKGSCIDFIPSSELVTGLVEIAKFYKIGHIEEIYAGLGILSALMKSQTNINITTSDTFTNPSICNQLNLVLIAKRGPSDFKYYEKLNEPYPEMIISSFYPSSHYEKDGCIIDFLNEISDMIQSAHHSIIVILLPYTFVTIYEMLHFVQLKGVYMVDHYYVKAIDKYFSLSKLLKHGIGMMAHILVKRELEHSVGLMLDQAILPPALSWCDRATLFKIMYDILPAKLIVSFYKQTDFTRPVTRDEFNILSISEWVNINKIMIPPYIYAIDELFFWISRAKNQHYFVFRNRSEFYTFYVTSKICEKENYPAWIITQEMAYIYNYFDVISAPGNWKTNRKMFAELWEAQNKQNKKALTK